MKQNNLLQKYIDQRSDNIPMKLTCIITILAIFSTILFSQNVISMEFVSPEEDQLELVESSLNLELSRCYLETYLMEADKETLQECSDNIMKYVQVLCGVLTTLESGKCDVAEQYMRYLHSEMNPSICKTDPSRCAAPPRPAY
jgi:hypothetical protein